MSQEKLKVEITTDGKLEDLKKRLDTFDKAAPSKELKAVSKKIGKTIQRAFVKHIDKQDLPWRPLSPITIHEKGNNRYLVDSGFLRNNIGFKVASSGDSWAISVGPGKTMHPSGKMLAEILFWLEYGTRHIPARPILRPTVLQIPELSGYEVVGFFGDFDEVLKGNIKDSKGVMKKVESRKGKD